MENQQYSSFTDYLKINFDFFDANFWWKYGLILFNLGIIIFLYIIKKLQSKPPVTKKNILLLTAHPDDESMFFIPTIKNLQENYFVYLLCLSNGNAYGLGKVREKELERVGNYLKLTKVEILNKEEFQDGMKEKWDPEQISEIAKKFIEDNSISAVITYDSKGISGHVNHIACYQGMKAFINNENNSGLVKDMKFYSLKSSGIVRNLNLWTNYRAMRMHYSQFVWYRQLFVFFSKYTYINTLEPLQ